MKPAKIILITLCSAVCTAAAYAGTLEGDRASSGVRFGESAVTGQAPAVSMSGNFNPVKPAALTAELKKEGTGIPVPEVSKKAARSKIDVSESTSGGALIGAYAGGGLGAIAGMVGGVMLTIGLAGAIGGPLGIAVAVVVVLLGGIGLGGSLGALVGGGVGAGIGAGIGALVGLFKKK